MTELLQSVSDYLCALEDECENTPSRLRIRSSTQKSMTAVLGERRRFVGCIGDVPIQVDNVTGKIDNNIYTDCMLLLTSIDVDFIHGQWWWRRDTSPPPSDASIPTAKARQVTPT